MRGTKIRTYSELIRFSNFSDRLNYLRLKGAVGFQTFGIDRYLNQRFYQSSEWRRFRREIIARDNGRDLAIPGLDIEGRIYIHHLNPIVLEDLVEKNEDVLNPEFVVCCSYDTHNAIHYGTESRYNKTLVERKPGDTCPWL